MDITRDVLRALEVKANKSRLCGKLVVQVKEAGLLTDIRGLHTQRRVAAARLDTGAGAAMDGDVICVKSAIAACHAACR